MGTDQEQELMTKPFHAMTTEEAIEWLDTNIEIGLTGEEAEKRLKEHGPNLIPIEDPWWLRKQ